MTKQQAIIRCGEWLAGCLRLGWSRDDLDALESLWWEYHDEHGHLKSRAINEGEPQEPSHD